MTREYRVLVDWDNDGFWCKTTTTSDPLNLIPDALLMRAMTVGQLDIAAGPTYTELGRTGMRYEETDYGCVIDRATQTAPVLRQMIVGRDRGGTGAAARIPVTPEVEHTASVYVKLIATAGTSDVTFVVSGVGDGFEGGLEDDTFTLIPDEWVRLTLTFTPPSYVPNVYLWIVCLDPDLDFTWEMTGWMVNVGATAPDYNTGSATNAYDDVTARIRDTLTFRDGLPYDDVFGTPAELVAGLANTDDFWNPNNASSPVYGAYRRGLGVMVEALVDAVPHTLWRGTLAKITLTGEDGNDPQGMLFAEDASDLMSRTEYAPPFQENVRVDEALIKPFDDGVLVYPTPGQFGFWDVSSWDLNWSWYENRVTEFDEALTTLPYAGDNLDRGTGINLQQYLRQILACECGGRFFWDAVIGRYVFHNRSHDANADLVEWEPGAPVDNPPLEWAWGDDVINHVDLNYETRSIGTPSTVVWEYDNLPLAMSAGYERKLNARYTSDDTDVQIAVKDGILPVAGTDYIANYTDGDEENANAILSVFAIFSANTAEVRMKNTSARPIEVTTLQLRGTPVLTRRAQSVTSRDATSIVANGLHKMSIDIPSINTETFAQQYADVRAHERSNPVKLLRQISFAAESSEDAETMVLQARVGDALNVDTGDGAQRYIVLARQHILDLSTTPEFHIASYTVKATARTAVCIWDSPLRGIWNEFVWGL